MPEAREVVGLSNARVMAVLHMLRRGVEIIEPRAQRPETIRWLTDAHALMLNVGFETVTPQDEVSAMDLED